MSVLFSRNELVATSSFFKISNAALNRMPRPELDWWYLALGCALSAEAGAHFTDSEMRAGLRKRASRIRDWVRDHRSLQHKG